MYITFIINHTIFYATNYVFITALICRTFNLSCYFSKVVSQFWQQTLGNYSLVLDINFIHASGAKSVYEKRMIVLYHNGIFWIWLGLMTTSASCWHSEEKMRATKKNLEKNFYVGTLSYWYDKIQFSCQYRNVWCYVPAILYPHPHSNSMVFC